MTLFNVSRPVQALKVGAGSTGEFALSCLAVHVLAAVLSFGPLSSNTRADVLSGYQVVASQPPLNVGVGEIATVTALCPLGKVAVGAGYRLVPANSNVNQAEVERGLELWGAVPTETLAGKHSGVRVVVRNAHAFQRANISAIAVCVNKTAGIRYMGTLSNPIGAAVGNTKGMSILSCRNDEVAIGGGFKSVTQFTHMKVGFPDVGGNAWITEIVQTGLAFLVPVFQTVVCAPVKDVVNHHVVDSGPASLGGHGQMTQTVRCSGNARVLAAGVADDTALTGLDMIVTRLAPIDAKTWDAKIHNRNVIGASGSVFANTRAICADVFP